MENNKETLFQQPPSPPPLKRPRLDQLWESREMELEEERWFRHMKDMHHTRARFENALNLLQERQNLAETSHIEDQAVTMAIRSHGLACGQQNISNQDFFSYRDVPRETSSFSQHWIGQREITLRPSPSMMSQLMGQSQSNTPQPVDPVGTDDILAQAVAVAILKKGLGALNSSFQ